MGVVEVGKYASFTNDVIGRCGSPLQQQHPRLVLELSEGGCNLLPRAPSRGVNLFFIGMLRQSWSQ